MNWIELVYYRGWRLFWDSDSGKMYAKDGGWGTTHHFYERSRDRASAIAIAKAWIDAR